MRVLLQHPHRPDEISGVMTYCEASRDALRPLGIEVVIQSTHDLTWRAAWQAVQKVDLVHLNSNHVGLTLAARMQGKPILIKYHYPFWDEIVEGHHEPMSFLRRCWRDTLFNWRSSIGRPLLGRLRFNAERLARSVLRVFVASMVNTRLGCSEFIARSTDLPWKTELDYNPFAFPEHAPKEATAITTRPGFVFAGRLHRTKGVDVLLEAAAILARRGHAFRVDIIGKGEEEKNLPALAKRLDLDSTVRFWGQLPHRYTMELMRQSLAIVVPSRWNDPAPYVIVETAAVGRPAIGARRGGIPELIGTDGLLFDSEDAEGLAAQMEMLLTQPGESTRRGVAALAALRKLCDEKVAARRLVRFYENLLHADLVAPAAHAATDEAECLAKSSVIH